MKPHKLFFLPILILAGWILTACDDAAYSSADPNVSGVHARATLEFVQAVQTSTALKFTAGSRVKTLEGLPCATV